MERLRRDPTARLLNLRPYVTDPAELAALPGLDPSVVAATPAALARGSMSAAHRSRLSAALAGHAVSPATRAAIGAGQAGRPKSPAHRARIAAGVRRQRAARDAD